MKIYKIASIDSNQLSVEIGSLVANSIRQNYSVIYGEDMVTYLMSNDEIKGAIKVCVFRIEDVVEKELGWHWN